MSDQDSSPTMEMLLQRLDELSGRVAELERRVTELEGSGQSSFEPPAYSAPTRPFTMVPPPAEVGKEELIAAIGQALTQLGGEAEVGAIRSHLAKNGMISVTRSDVNKALYNRKDLFEITRTDGIKPIWKPISG